jgi:transcription initiation factor TFIID subunit 2
VYTTNDSLPGSTSSWLPCIDGLWERCPWQLEITVPKRIRDIFPKQVVRTVHRTRSSHAIHNGDVPTHVPEKPVRQSDFSQEELDLEMVIVCTGDFVKEVLPLLIELTL